MSERLMIGRVISHYKIMEKIGEGGMGEVYLAEDIKLGRKVAIKILSKKLTERQGARLRFQREARAAATLNHPNIVTVHEIAEYEDLIYIVMEFVEGDTLDKRVIIQDEDGETKTAPLHPLKVDEIIDIVLEVCRGLVKAHDAGVVHRDIKLENILLSRDGGVKILDFGLAKLKGASKLTGDSVAVGTAFYMSPEQLSGDEFDHRIDIWALGVLMYVMVTGQLPFTGDTNLEIIYSIMKDEPEPIIKLNRQTPPALRMIINRCLKKDVKKRYQYLHALIKDLEQVKEGLLTGKKAFRWRVTSMADSFRDRGIKIAAAGLAVLLTLTILLSVRATSLPIKKFFGLDILPTRKHLALLPFKIEAGETADHAAFSRGLAESLTRKLVRLEQFDKNLIVITSNKLQMEDVKEIPEARQKLGVNLTFTGDLSWGQETVSLTINLIAAEKGDKLYSYNLSRKKTEFVDFRDSVLECIVRMLEIETQPVLFEMMNAGCTTVPGAYEIYLRAWGYLQNSMQLEHIEPAINLFDRAIDAHSDYALAYAGLAEAYYRKYRAAKEEQWLEQAIAACGSAEEKDARLAAPHIIKGKIFTIKKQYEEALQAYRAALEKDPVNWEAFSGTAVVYGELGDPEKAKETYLEFIRRRGKDYRGYNNLGFFYYKQNRWEDALRAFEEVVKLSPDYVTGLNNLGGLYFYLGQRKKAQEMFEKSLAVRENYKAYNNLGTLYFYEAFYNDAIRMFSKALEMEDGSYSIWGYLAESYYWSIPRQEDKVRSSFREAADLAEIALAGQPGNAEILSSLAFYHERLGNRPQAQALLDLVVKEKSLTSQVMLNIANVYEQMKNREKALEWIKKALAKGVSLAEIMNNPGLRELRSEPRFKALLNEREAKEEESQSNLK